MKSIFEMKWEKQGLIYEPNGKYFWNQSHSQVPVVDCLNDKIWRIYFAARDQNGKSRTSYIHVEAGNPKNILYEHTSPILNLGEIGTFDDCGIMPAWLVNHGSKKFLYYIGWTVKHTVPYQNSIGLAISSDNGNTFRKYSKGPIFGQNTVDPFFSGTICVLKENQLWRAWYLSCTKWQVINLKPEPFYHIKYAESNDGINWNRQGKVAIDYLDNSEGGIASASVLKEDDGYKMWYSYRNSSGYRENRKDSYRIGFAMSNNGIDWVRMDNKSGIDLSKSGWDSEMIAYPFVIKYQSKRYLFYNGNGFGKSGMGYAIY